MPLDETWLAITKLYAIVVMLALFVVTAALIHLGVKAWRLMKAGKRTPKLAAQLSKHTADLLRSRGEALVSRWGRLGPVCRTSFERIAAKLRDARDLIEH